MSSETKAKRNATSNPPTMDDHRKRRRNRTTQSCLNCHTSKRMCDRKRPACARCTQLGLTGLCVYEVDDPSQRPDSQDESARLLKRVAELEGVIRELKNKPHPRWSQPGSSSGERWHSRSQLGGEPDSQGSLSDTSSSEPLSDTGGSPLIGRVTTGNVYLPKLPNRRLSPHSRYHASSPQSTPSPSLMTPTEEYSHLNIPISVQPDISPDYDLSSMFFEYPGDYGVVKTGRADETCFIKQHGGHCGCLHEPTNYNTVLELSIRLRKAADVLARSPSHHIDSNCLLNQRISDLDTFATNALGNVMTSPEDSAFLNQDRSNAHKSNPPYGPTSRRLSSKYMSPTNLHSWDTLPTASSPLTPCDDSFMSWEPPRRGA